MANRSKRLPRQDFTDLGIHDVFCSGSENTTKSTTCAAEFAEVIQRHLSEHERSQLLTALQEIDQ